MTPSRSRRTRRDRGFRRRLAAGLLASVFLHLLLALTWRGPVLGPPDRSAAASPAAAGRPSVGGALRAVTLRPSDAARLPSRPDRIEPAEEPDVRFPRVAESVLPSGELERPSEGAGAPGGGSGRSGPAVDRPPVPRSVMPEWDPPASVRGRAVTVRVHVDSTGSPTGLVELVPRTTDEAFNRRLVRKIRAMSFSPARDRRGRPVAAWAELTFEF